MRRKWSAVVVVLACSLLCGASVQAAMYYTHIENQSSRTQGQASYADGSFTWHMNDIEGYNLLTLFEDTATLSNAYDVSLDVTLAQFIDFGVTLTTPAPRAYFRGGMVDLRFTYDDEFGTPQYYQLKGPVTQASAAVTSVQLTPEVKSTVTSVINFDTNDALEGVESLPDSNNWPATGESTGIGLTLVLNYDLRPFLSAGGWENNTVPGTTFSQTQFSFWPEERPIPEPATVLLLIGGGLLMARRRTA